MSGIVFKFFGLATLAIVTIYLVAGAFRRGRRLDTRIREFRKEQDGLARQGKSRDPYADLAEIYAEHNTDRPKKPQPGGRRL